MNLFQLKKPVAGQPTLQSSLQRSSCGFTLIEVLIAMAITALVAAIAYGSLARVMAGVEGLRESADRTYEINRALMILSRDIRHFVVRPIRDEFGELEPAMTGGEQARFDLSFTRTGWHNPNEYPRSHLQRVNYRIEDEALWRDSYVVLDRAGDTEPQSVLLLDDVEYMDVAFLPSLNMIQPDQKEQGIDTSSWPDSWILDTSTPGATLKPPVAIEIRLQLPDLGEMKRLYVLSL